MTHKRTTLIRLSACMLAAAVMAAASFSDFSALRVLADSDGVTLVETEAVDESDTGLLVQDDIAADSIDESESVLSADSEDITVEPDSDQVSTDQNEDTLADPVDNPEEESREFSEDVVDGNLSEDGDEIAESEPVDKDADTEETIAPTDPAVTENVQEESEQESQETVEADSEQSELEDAGNIESVPVGESESETDAEPVAPETESGTIVNPSEIVYFTNPHFPEYDAKAEFQEQAEAAAARFEVIEPAEQDTGTLSAGPRRTKRAASSDEPVYFDSREETVAALHTAILNFQKTMTVYFRMDGNVGFDSPDLRSLLQSALYLGGSTGAEQGDYLDVIYRGYSASLGSTYYEDGDYTEAHFWLSFSYASSAEIETELNAAINAILSDLNIANESDYEKIRAIYDYLTRNVTYDYENLNKDGYDRRQTAAGAILDKTSVCEGYAAAFFRMCWEVGVTNVRIISGRGNGGLHAWNIVALPVDSGDSYLYYNMDVTWDAGAGNYRYFLRAEGDVNDTSAFDYLHIRNGDTRSRPYWSTIPVVDTWINFYDAAFISEHPMSTVDYDYASADITTNESDYTFTVTGNAATITGYSGSETQLVIPETLGGASVRYIAADAFRANHNLTSVTMPSTLYSIGNTAFFSCSELAEVNLNEALTAIGMQAFDYTKITELHLPVGMLDCSGYSPKTLVGYSMDADGKYYRVRDGILYHYDGEWKLCSYPTAKPGDNYTVPAGIASIEKYAVIGTKLRNVSIDGDVRSIEQLAFSGNDDLEHIIIGAGVSEVTLQAFNFTGGEQTSVVSVELLQSEAPKMGNSAFDGSKVFYNINSDVVFHLAVNSTGWNNMPGTVVYDLGAGDLLKGYTLSIADEIYFNYYMKLTDGMIANPDTAYMEINDNGQITQIPVSQAVGTAQVNGETCHVFKYEVPAKNMADDITAAIYDENGIRSTTHTFSVESYLEYIYQSYQDNKVDSRTGKLARTLLNYGGFAQAYFGYGTGHLANHSLYPYDVYNVTAENLSKFGDVSINTFVDAGTGQEDPGIRYYGSSLILKAKTKMRLYFSLENTDKLQYVNVDGVQITPTRTGMLYYITVDGISGANLAEQHTIDIYSADGSVTIALSPMNYAYKVISGNSGKESLVNLMKAMFLYHQAASEYLNGN